MVNQGLILLAMFLVISGTFPFRVGLLGPLLSQFKAMLYLYPIYVVVSLLHGAYRMVGGGPPRPRARLPHSGPRRAP